ncbi:hypothetical protein MTR67_040315 [Solanum verrucosum]|uniref:Uncharacterized protein n=1 Tax=Solanum verrucosum TaxID=315347 RepID=A0AAF0UID7_SOLVR|nr:hypothetical protein MTR67_040315 [Solanum verrucosum]
MFIERLKTSKHASILLRADPKSSSADKKNDATTSIEKFDANKFSESRNYVSAIVSGPVTCEVTFNEPPVRKFPIKLESDDLMNFIGIILSLLKQFEINL